MSFPNTTAATNPATTPSNIPATTPATSYHQHGQNDTPDHPPARQPMLTKDFHLDTFFNPAWTSGPHVFSFAKDGTVVRPQTYALEPYPGYHADGARLAAANAQHFQDFSSQHSTSSRNMAIAGQGPDAAAHARARANAVHAWQQGQAGYPQCSMPDEGRQVFVYTWPPKPLHSQASKDMAIAEQSRRTGFAEAQATLRENAVNAWRQSQAGRSRRSMLDGEEPELVYTWPPKPRQG